METLIAVAATGGRQSKRVSERIMCNTCLDCPSKVVDQQLSNVVDNTEIGQVGRRASRLQMVSAARSALKTNLKCRVGHRS
jgi:hypothetical protein